MIDQFFFDIENEIATNRIDQNNQEFSKGEYDQKSKNDFDSNQNGQQNHDQYDLISYRLAFSPNGNDDQLSTFLNNDLQDSFQQDENPFLEKEDHNFKGIVIHNDYNQNSDPQHQEQQPSEQIYYQKQSNNQYYSDQNNTPSQNPINLIENNAVQLTNDAQNGLQEEPLSLPYDNSQDCQSFAQNPQYQNNKNNLNFSIQNTQIPFENQCQSNYSYQTYLQNQSMKKQYIYTNSQYYSNNYQNNNCILTDQHQEQQQQYQQQQMSINAYTHQCEQQQLQFQGNNYQINSTIHSNSHQDYSVIHSQQIIDTSEQTDSRRDGMFMTDLQNSEHFSPFPDFKLDNAEDQADEYQQNQQQNDQQEESEEKNFKDLINETWVQDNENYEQLEREIQNTLNHDDISYMLDGKTDFKLKNFPKTILKYILHYLGEGNKVYKEFIDNNFKQHNLSHLLLLFPHFAKNLKGDVVKDLERKKKLGDKDMVLMRELRVRASEIFSNKFYYITRLFKGHGGSKNVEEFYYGCLFYADRESKAEFSPPNQTNLNIFKPIQSRLKSKLMDKLTKSQRSTDFSQETTTLTTNPLPVSKKIKKGTRQRSNKK